MTGAIECKRNENGCRCICAAANTNDKRTRDSTNAINVFVTKVTERRIQHKYCDPFAI